jgi:hypothetical protein
MTFEKKGHLARVETEREHVTAFEAEVEIVQSQNPRIARYEDEEDELEQDVEHKPAVSKARLIILVLTVTGAAFLNVGISGELH